MNEAFFRAILVGVFVAFNLIRAYYYRKATQTRGNVEFREGRLHRALRLIVGMPLIWWVQWALGANFSTVLYVRDEHTLVTYGPYRWVRHPMYTVLYVWAVSLFLLSQNWFIGADFLVPLTLIVVTRLKHEEAAMVEKFGDDYRHYMRRTGRFLPRFS